MQQKSQNLLEMLCFTVKRYPNESAVLWKEDGKYFRFSYFELWDLIRQFAFALRQLGVQRNTKVAIFAKNGPHWLISDFAILSLGAVTVPIDPASTGAQARWILQHADVEVAIVQNLEMMTRVVSWPDPVKKVIMIEGSIPDHPMVIPLKRAMDQGKASPIIDRWGWQTLGRKDPATIVHAAGTADHPKLAMLSHGNLLSNVENLQHLVPVSHRDTFLSFLPLSLVFERTVNQFAAVAAGGTIAYAESAETIPQSLLEIKPTLLTGVPQLFEQWYARVMEAVEQRSPLKRRVFRWALRVGEERYRHVGRGPGWPVPLALEKKYLRAKGLVFSKIYEKTGGQLRLMISCGASLHPEVSRFFAIIGLPVLESYGMAACAPVVACNPVHRIKPGTAGRPIPGTEVKLTDDGELLVKSPGTMMGYYNQPAETAKTVVNGWLHTGDIAQIDEDGYLRIVDRKENLITLSTGKSVAPQPVVSALTASRFIQQAALVGNHRSCVGALIFPDYDALTRHARANGWAAETKEELVRRDPVRQLLREEIDRLTAGFAPFERPKKFSLLTEPFTLERGELTPAQRVRIRAIEDQYAEIIDALYSEEDEEFLIASDHGSAPPAASDISNVVPLFNESDSGEGTESPSPEKPRWKKTWSRQVIFGTLVGILAGILVHVLI